MAPKTAAAKAASKKAAANARRKRGRVRAGVARVAAARSDSSESSRSLQTMVYSQAVNTGRKAQALFTVAKSLRIERDISAVEDALPLPSTTAAATRDSGSSSSTDIAAEVTAVVPVEVAPSTVAEWEQMEKDGWSFPTVFTPAVAEATQGSGGSSSERVVPITSPFAIQQALGSAWMLDASKNI